MLHVEYDFSQKFIILLMHIIIFEVLSKVFESSLT